MQTHRPRNFPTNQHIERDPKRSYLTIAIALLTVVLVVTGFLVTGAFDAALKALKEGLGL